jgi:serine/threonine protein kinase
VTRLDDSAVSRLRAAVREPDLSQTKYRLAGVAGAGGMGTVYIVEDTELHRRVALKVLDAPDHDVPGAGIEARLRREAQVLARLEHPGIVPVHDVGTLPDGRVFYTMKWVQGDRLDGHLRPGMPLAQRLRLFLRVADPVAFAHANGVLHRDLKPENVMVGAFGEILVMDWGLAKVVGDSRGLEPTLATGGSAVLGTPGFMSPEQEAGGSASVDARADVYALGAVLQWMAGGDDVPAVRAICRKAMAARPEERYPDVVSLAADVTRFLDGASVSAYSESVVRRALRVAKRHRVALGMVAAYLVLRALILLFTGR